MNMTQEQFDQKFWDKLGLNEAFSPVVATQQRLVGFIFSALDQYQSKATAYNGGTGVIPDHRGQNLVQGMYDQLTPKLREAGYQQCVLEVLTHNARAITAYTRSGFSQGNLLRCYRLERLPNHAARRPSALSLAQTPTPNWDQYAAWSQAEASFQDQWSRLPLNPHEQVWEAHWEEQKAGVIVFQPHLGRISALAVAPEFRERGIGTYLIHQVVSLSAQPHLTVINVREADASLHGFFTGLNFQNQINQYEMTLPLT